MSLIDRAFELAKIELHRDVPVMGKRRMRDIATVIGLCRKLESQEQVYQDEQNRRVAELAAQNVQLIEAVHKLEHENEQFKLKERMRPIELTKKDQQFLLTGASEEAA